MQYKCNCTKIFYSEILLHENPKIFFFLHKFKKRDRGHLNVDQVSTTAETRNRSSKQTSQKPSTYFETALMVSFFPQEQNST